MGTIIGLLTGAFVTYFFTRGAVDNAQFQARNAIDVVALQERRLGSSQQALTKAAGLLPPEQWSALQEDPIVRIATSPNGDGNSPQTVVPVQ